MRQQAVEGFNNVVQSRKKYDNRGNDPHSPDTSMIFLPENMAGPQTK